MYRFTISLLLYLHLLNTIIIIGILTTVFSDPIFIRNETDRMALLAIKSKITLDPHQVLSSWNDSTHFCLWQGVTCGRHHKRVTILDLRKKHLVGTLSPFVGNLSFLQHLLLSNNSFSSHIPSEVGRLNRLQILHLVFNSFEGKIPANISGCSELKQLSLSRNKLVGKIPSELSFLSKLEILGLDYNNFTGDDLSPLSNLTSLQELYLSNQIYEGGHGFHGTVPDYIGKFNNLTVLSLGGNSFTGKIPLSIYNLSKLQTLSISSNRLEGSLSPEIGFYFPQLKWLQFGFNQLSGPIPYSLSNLSKIEFIELSSNNFTGKFFLDGRNLPHLSQLYLDIAILGRGETDELNFLHTLINCSHLEVLEFRGNYLGGILPQSIGNMSTKLRRFDCSYNQISGSIPLGLGNIVNLEYLYLNDNQFAGRIPTDLGKIPRLQVLFFSDNQLSGSIPSSLGNLSYLSSLELGNNKFKGIVPSTLGNCKRLVGLGLEQNNFVGNIPPQIFQASALVELYLEFNLLHGSIPLEIGGLQNLLSVDMSYNNLSGTIPSSIGQCLGLTGLYLENNSFIGSIPQSFILLKSLQEIDLSSNKLSGQLPKYFSNFSYLTLMNLSFNNLEGEVPTKGVFANVSAISLIGNTNLCGGIPQLKLPSCPRRNSKGKTKLRPIVIGACISLVFLGLAILSSVYLLCSKGRREASSKEPLFKEPIIKVSYDMLLRATDGFSPEHKIGSGSFGSVYRGILLIEGVEKVVAIKVINNQHQGASRSFLAECEALRVIRHRNLVRVITACSSIDFQGNVFKALVYELMSKGSLEKWLYSNSEDHDQCQNLNLPQRLNVAIDVAHALDYIHNGIDTPIIHCDLKPTNILLDEDLTAHVGDFGLVKLLPEVSELLHNSSSIGVRGTVGYAAPEYGLGASVSRAGDVYSYGIILLEMMTAKKPIDQMFEGDMSLHKFAESALADHVLDIVDPKLKVDDGENRSINLNDTREIMTKCAVECITSVITIGVRCSSELPQDRMDIKDVIRQLQSQRDNLLLCGKQHRSKTNLWKAA